MTDYFLFLVLGLGTGAVVALMSCGLVVGYRGSGVINFSVGSIAMYTAYVYFGLRTSSRYLIPIPGLPSFARIGPAQGLDTPTAFAISALTAALLGLLMHLLIFRPLRNAPMLAKVVATIGVMLLLQSAVAYRYGTNSVAPPRFLPSGSLFTVGGVRVPADQITLAGIAIVLGAALWCFFRYSRLGLSMRAAAENEKGAVLLGYSPDVQAGINWVLASTVAGIGGILVAPITTLTPTGFSLLIVPALAAALVARFTSIPLAVGAGLVIGIAQSELQNLPAKISWFPSVGTQDAFPFVLIAIFLAFTGRRIPERGTVVLGKLPRVPKPSPRAGVPVLGFGVLATVLLLVLGAGFRLAIINSVIGALLCLSLVVLTGYLGQISLFQLALAGVSAYAVVGLTAGLGVPFPIAPILGALAGAATGLIVAIPSLRIRGATLAVATLAAGVAIESMFFNNPDYTGGTTGVAVRAPRLFGYDFSFNHGRTVAQPIFGILCVVVLVVLALLILRIRGGTLGRRMLAVRSNERAAAACGVLVAQTKLIGCTLAAFVAGAAGSLMAYQQGTVTATAFDALLSVAVLAAAYLGGITRVSGALVGGLLTSGGIVYYLFDRYLFTSSDQAANLEQLITGLGLVLAAVANPDGLTGALSVTAQSLRRRLTGRGPDAGPTAPPSRGPGENPDAQRNVDADRTPAVTSASGARAPRITTN